MNLWETRCSTFYTAASLQQSWTPKEIFWVRWTCLPTATGGGTIDIRVDYLMPGKGEHLIASGTFLRKGNQILAIRTELHNEKNELIAIGTATYKIPGAGSRV